MPTFIEAVLDDRRAEAAAELWRRAPYGFPRPGERRFLEYRLRQMREDARFETWCPNVVVLDGQMIGHAGYRTGLRARTRLRTRTRSSSATRSTRTGAAGAMRRKPP